MILEINNRLKSRPDLNLVKRAAAAFARTYKIGASKQLSLAIIGDAEMKKLNRAYRGQNRPTDILSFAGEGAELGELVIDYAQIKRQAKTYGKSANQELIFIFIHGLLHLAGYNDEKESGRLKMIKLGEKLMEKIKF